MYFGNWKITFGEKAASYFETMKVLVVIWIMVTIIMILKFSGKGEYDKIEHGSADWCTDQEKYSVLSSKEGMILAQKTYLYIDNYSPFLL